MSIGPGAANGACHFDWQFSAGLRSTTAALAAAALAHVQAKPPILCREKKFAVVALTATTSQRVLGAGTFAGSTILRARFRATVSSWRS